MQLEIETGNKLIEYLKSHGYPENSIAVEYKIGENYRVDIAILDQRKNIPIQLFEIKSRKTPEMINRGKEQLKNYLSVFNNKNIPTYLVFPKKDEPYFQIENINLYEQNDDKNEEEQYSITFNYSAQRVARINEEASIIKKEKVKVIDTFKIICWIVSGCVFTIGFLSKLKLFDISATDLSIIGTSIALIIIPYASKLKILGIEFERLVKEEKKEA